MPGRPTADRSEPQRALAEAYGAIDIRAWQRCRRLSPGTVFALPWPQGEDSDLVAEARVAVREDRVDITVEVAFGPNDAFPIDYHVSLDHTPAQFGGRRAWFICPEPGCGRRVAILYWYEGELRCRTCARLMYRSQRQSPFQRAATKLERIAERFDAAWHDDGTATLRRPKGMHGRTWSRWQERIAATDQAYIHLAAAKAAPLLARAERAHARACTIRDAAAGILEG